MLISIIIIIITIIIIIVIIIVVYCRLFWGHPVVGLQVSMATSKSTIGVDHAIRDQPCPSCPHCYGHLHHVDNHLGDWTSGEKENSSSTINNFFCVNLFVRNGNWKTNTIVLPTQCILPVLLQAGSLLSGPLQNMFGMRGMFLLVSSVLMATTLGYLLLYYAVLKRLVWIDSFNMIELFVGS